ncbi:hypothetical protein BGZ93_007517 [Podila epicladia]|nr:hypothetical protein BGZ93_007517 [Podila epicladia]
MFYGVQTTWDYATSKLFIVLPSDLNSWEDKNPSTHKFRLYFLCDNSLDIVAQSGIPQHVHFSNHPGYNLLQPEEFFKKYGDYVLRVLWMVKLGYSNNVCDIPSINTLSILWKYTYTSSSVSKRTLRKLVDKVIAHIEHISPPKWIMAPGLSRDQSAGIKAYLQVQEGDNAEGNLQRHIDSHQCVSWRCQVHKEQHFNWRHLTSLKGYVDGRMGHIDMQQARLQVVLQSYAESYQLQRHLAGITQSFNLSIKLNWNTTRTDVENICQTIAKRKTVALEIDGISVNIYPRGYVPYTRNIFADKVVPDTDTGLQLITVLNYPVPGEQCIHIGNFSLQSRLLPSHLTRSWVELRSDLEYFGNIVSNAEESSEFVKAARELRLVQEKYGLSDDTSITIHNENWAAVFNVEEGAVVEAYSLDAACPMAVHSSGSLRKLTVDLHDLEFDKEFFQLVKTSPDLNELNVSYYGHDVFYYFEHIAKAWQESSSRYCLTLIDRLQDTQGRIVARMRIQRCDSEGSRITLGVDHIDSISPTAQKKVTDVPSTEIDYLDWSIDQVSAQVFGRTATLLDMATQQHSSALKLFTLDVSQLEVDGLMSVQNVLERSRLEHLNVVCNPIDPNLSQALSQVLSAVKWETIKSLVLSGNNVNEWLDLCPSPEAPQLLSLQICGTGLAPQKLTHSSVLFIHQLAHESTLEKLDFKGVQMREASDWTVIMDAVDPAYLKSLGLCESSMTQLQSNTDATDLFDAKFNKNRVPKMEHYMPHQLRPRDLTTCPRRRATSFMESKK